MKNANKNQLQNKDRSKGTKSNTNASNKNQNKRGSHLTQEDRIRGGEHSHGGASTNQDNKNKQR